MKPRVVSIAVSLFLALTWMGSTASAAEFSCVPSFADLENPVPAHFSEGAIAEFKRSYFTKEVRGLRSGLNAYLAGTADALTMKTMRNVPTALVRRRFKLQIDEPGLFGGYDLTVQFVGRPDAMYSAWIYDVGNEWEIRSWEQAVCSPAEQRWLRIRYSDLANMAMSG